MGLFNDLAAFSGLSESSIVNEAELQEIMEELENVDDVEVNDDLMEACISAAIANEQNLNLIITSVAHEEMNYFVENGTEMIYEEGKISAFFDKVKAMIKKAWEKIKSIFNKAIDYITSWVSTDKSFVSKHSEKIKKYASKITIKGYQVNENTMTKNAPYDLVATAARLRISKLDKGQVESDIKVDDVIGEIRAAATHAGGKVSSDDLVKNLKEHFGVANESSSVTYGAEVILNELSGGKSTKRTIKNGYDTAKKGIGILSKEIDTLEKNAKNLAKNTGGSVPSNSFGKAASICSGTISVLNTCQRIHLNAVNAFHHNCRKIAAKCVSYKEEEKSTNESFSFDDLMV